jgi:hypothetical protein
MTVITTPRGVVYGWAPGERGWGAAMSSNMLLLDDVVRRTSTNVFNPKDALYGAVGDGVADDTAAVVACDAAAAAAGAIVMFPDGVYLLSTITPTAREWVGTSRHTVTLKHKAGALADTSMITAVSDLSIKKITFDGNRANQANRTKILSFNGVGGKSLFIGGVRFTGSVTNAIKLDNISQTVEVDDCDFDNVGPGLSTVPGFESNAIHAWHCTTGRMSVTNCRFINIAPTDVTQAPTAILVTGNAPTSTFAVSVRGNHFENFGSVVNSTGVVDIYQYCAQVDVSHNTFRKAHYSTVKVVNSHAATVHGNTVSDITSPFTAPLFVVSLNARSTGSAWSCANVIGNTIRNATAHRGFAYDFTTDQIPSAGSPWNISDNVADQVYGGMRLYGLQDAVLTGNIIRGATSTTETFPALSIQQCSGLVQWSGGTIAGSATVGVRVNDVMTNLRLKFRGVDFRNNVGTHVKIDDTIGLTTMASLRVSDCDFFGGASPISVNRSGSVIITDCISDSSTVTLTSVATSRQEGNSWQPARLSGSGSPEGVVTAVVSSTYQRTDGSASTSLYVKESGTGNTGWVAK